MVTTLRHFTKGLLTLLSTALLFSCERPGQADVPPKQPAKVPQDTTHVDSAANGERQTMLALKIYGTENPYVGPKELVCARLDHADFIHQGTSRTSNSSIGSFSFHCTVKALALQTAVDALNSCTGGGPATHAVTVHYGLTENFFFVPALQVQCLKYVAAEDKYYLEKNNDCYLINADGSLTFKADGLLDWDAMEGKRYRDRVYVSNYPAAGFRKFDASKDPRAMVFPYEYTLADLISDNGLLTAGALEITQISTPEKYTADVGENFQAEIAWIPVGVTLSGTVDPYRHFREKAADLGSPCPPSCPEDHFAFKTQGTMPRAGCQNR